MTTAPLDRRSPGIYLGVGWRGPVHAGSEQAVLVLGPPRAGKTSSVVIPAVVDALGAVLSTSTKPDVLAATVSARRRHGPCYLYDPTGTVEAPAGVERLRWSPVDGCRAWDEALRTARALVGARRARPDADHWSERAEALLACLLHAAAVEGSPMAQVVRWVDRHEAGAALGRLDAAGAGTAGDLLAGIAATDSREQSGIWSTASGVLAAYRSGAALASTERPTADPARLVAEGATVYVCAAGRDQAVTAPLVVGLVDAVRHATYRRAGDGRTDPPVLLALDEVANIAPLPDLPSIVSEGGGQGLLTLACLQDLSQARARWGPAADGFLTLFGATVVFPGVADLATLEVLSRLAGEEEVAARSVSTTPLAPATRWWSAATGARVPSGPSVTVSTTWRPRLPVDTVSRGRPGHALVLGRRGQLGWVRVTPWHELRRGVDGPAPGREHRSGR